MKWGKLSTVITAAASLACGGAGTPEGVVEEAAATPEGVYGRAAAATQGLSSVVVLEPLEGTEAPVPAEPALMDQLGLRFLPRELIVVSGQPIEFVNSETLAHNVHLVFIENDSSVYNADMDPDDRRVTLLEQEGAYDVTCDVHPGMTAVIFVTSSPHAAFAEQDGSYVIPDVPSGSYTARVWNASPDLRLERVVEVRGTSTELDLVASP